ncbi:LacI family DNA-binding transcriptional regulator [Loigolactobacillus jiayinensis]|uniref:LacI family DNA-binding transcriptional regulator n=1 Tax=Loigolactobacillus jiayinensis TaxID=2486016 RepID=A0ABW1REJ9_9LACO|nr:LacI family DNA-binding transcriptional regulator [Loigolactobacillus jiayinensis]
MTTIQDVAKRANVSKSTVSQYLNHHYNFMSIATRKKVAQAIEDLNYVPNQLARGLRQKKTHMVGIIVSTIRSRFTTEIIEALEAEFQKVNVQILVCNVNDDPEKEGRYITSLVARQVDGIITFPFQANQALYQNLIDQKIPLVFLDRQISGLSQTVDTILLDNKAAVTLAMDEFMQNGHTRIGIITFPYKKHPITTRVERMQGYHDYIATHKQLIDSPDYVASGDITQIMDLVAKMRHLEQPPTALLAGNDMILEQILLYVQKYQLKIPDNFSLIGIDNIAPAIFFSPSITTIAQPTYEMGTNAAIRLIYKVGYDDVKLPETYELIKRAQPQFMRRNSVKKIII